MDGDTKADVAEVGTSNVTIAGCYGDGDLYVSTCIHVGCHVVAQAKGHSVDREWEVRPNVVSISPRTTCSPVQEPG